MRTVCKGVIISGLIFAVLSVPAITGALSPEARNIGPMVNSEYSDFAPVVSPDGTYLFFTSDRPGGLGGQDIWETNLVDGRWTKPANLGVPINTKGNEGPDCFVDENGHRMLYLTLCSGLDAGLCDIFVSEQLSDGSWSAPRNVGAPINSEYSDANASWDYVNQIMYFVSTRPGGYKGPGPKLMPNESSYDIWMCPKRPDGTWGQAQNLGSPINTPNWEGVAFFHSAEQTLYFSSDGHGGMGGADVFRSRMLSPGQFDTPEPVDMVNTPENDMYFSIPAAGDFAYYSSNTPGGVGNEDIYYIPVTVLLETQVIALRPMQIQTQPQRPAATTRIAASHIDTIYFDFDKSILLLSEKEKLDKISDFLLENPGVSIEIAGHADSVGTDDYNVLLSKSRADSVLKYLKDKGVAPERMVAVYYGENKPAEKNDPRYGNPLNRRVEISLQ